MLRDLNSSSAAATHQRYDVAVVGAGLIGTIMACELARAGLSVAVIESGAESQRTDEHPLNRVIQTAQRYGGADHGRFRCLGGTSTRWGGALIPFLAGDLVENPAEPHAGWPLRIEDLLRHLPRLEQIFDLPQSAYEPPDSVTGVHSGKDPGFVVRSPKWPAFGRRNVAAIFAAQLRSPQGPDVWINATVTGFALNEGGRIVAIKCAGSAGTALNIAADEVIVAAGAIESTRLLLKLDHDHGQQIFQPKDLIGRYFHDHLSIPTAEVQVSDREALNRISGFRFEGSGMRNTRFELESKTRIAGRLPGGFAHISFATRGATGFDGLRNIYRSLQRRQLPALSDVAISARNAGWISRAAWTRYVNKRVLVPAEAHFEVHVVTEQEPVASNRITLSPAECDAFGVPLAQIHWEVSESDVANTEAFSAAFAEYWSRSSLAQMGRLRPYGRNVWSGALRSTGGIYHPGGSLKMGASANLGVVDRELRTFAVPNLRVVSTATFPTGGSANPTMMLGLMGLRLVDSILHESEARTRGAVARSA